MKQKLLLIILARTSVTFAQQFPIGAYRIFEEGLGSSTAAQLQKIMPQLQSAYFNYGTAYVNGASSALTNQVLDSAANHGINTILFRCEFMDHYPIVERF